MREPDFFTDGWAIDNGEERHAESPETFWLPPLEERNGLVPGDYAKLIFRISLDDENDEVAVERMWVVVRGRLGNVYFGILDNEPDSIVENDDLWLGTEVPFRAEHVINILPRDAKSVDFASRPPRRAWPRD